MHRFLFRRIPQFFLGAGVTNGYLKGFIPPGTLWQGPSKGFCVPGLNCYACPSSVFACPIGTLQHYSIIRAVPVYFIGFFVLFCVAVGRMACGTFCPFGLLQDLLHKVPSSRLRIPPWMTYIRYAVLLGLVLIIPFFTFAPWFSKLCPVGTLIAGIPWVAMNPEIRLMVGELFFVKLAILLLVVVLSILSKRPFCRVICPLGAIFSLFNRISILRLSWDEESCTHCDKCTRICPMDISIYKDANSHNCIRCLDCTQCPAVSVHMGPLRVPVPARECAPETMPGVESGCRV